MTLKKLMCPKCAHFIMTEPFAGWKMRRQMIVAQRPEKHGYETRGVFVSKDALRCDNCNEVVNNGKTLVAVTQWPKQESEPEMWELKYGKKSSEPSYR